MNARSFSMSRRGVLRAAGVCVGLPLLESLGRWSHAADEPTEVPRRLAYLYVPNGVNVAQWQVTGSGENYELSPTLAPLAPLRKEFAVISGLNHENATPGPDGGGDHSRATAVYLTGVRPKKTGGSDIRNGVSIDQVIGQRIGRLTRLPSLELSTDGARITGRCDSGYSCAYQFNLSWSSSTSPVPAEQNPRAAFERLFGEFHAGDGGADARRELRQSVLDFVLDDAHTLARQINAADRDKLDQYLTALRDVEERIGRAEQAPVPLPDFERPQGIPDSYQEHVRMMFDIIALAFQADATRMITFTLANDGSNRAFPEIGVPEAHHQLSHHRGNQATLEKIARIDQFYVEQLAWFLERLRAIPEGDGTLLDASMILYGGCISEGNQHLHSNLPLVLAGRGGGTLHPGKRLEAADPTPMCNLHVALAQRMGLKIDRFGDSTGSLPGI
ncbi:MAG TPA: DUF1552 domain-containing protein [Pirellulaceae bacterium]|nr:DUF1552 domain-containing protein [Pirellulaceae bacterium]